MRQGYGQHLEPPEFGDIVDPDGALGPQWLWHLASRSSAPGVLTLSLAVLGVLVGLIAYVAGGPAAGIVVATVALAGTAAAGAIDLRLAHHRVTGTNPSLGGQPIVGEGLALLVDISKRFAFAKRKVDELPDLVDWSSIAPAVEAIRWDAARHAAGLSASEDRWRDVAHAPAGTPQAALRARIAAERADELEILGGYQRTADRLMNRAADAAAAATVAAELGYDLEVATRSPGAARAAEKLEVVIERLDALTAAWRALDTSTDLAAELLTAEAATRDMDARDRARALSDRLDEATGRSATSDEGSG